MARRRARRKWEEFAGRNRFWCDGRLMTAPQPAVFALTLALIAGTCALHFAVDCPYLAARVSPAVPAAGALLAALTLCSLLRTALSDPGIVPRAAPAEAAHAHAAHAAAPDRPPPRAREVLVRGRPVKLKYCFTCKMFRPPRASHCSLCDNCVERFDHHCPWVGNCVGRRNYRHFYTFVVSLSFLCVFVFACAVTHLALLARAGGLGHALRASPASALVAAVCFLAVWSVLGLAGFHTYLAATDQTTNEDIKGSFSGGGGGGNPYSRGSPCANCWHVLCGPLAPSLIDRRGPLGDDDLPPAFRRACPPPPAIGLPAIGLPAIGLPAISQEQPKLASGSYSNLFEGGEGAAGGGGGGHRHAYMNHSLDLDLQEVCIGGGGLPASASAAAAASPAAGDVTALTAPGAAGAGATSPASQSLSAARLRLLHDTTMIDAALDLDEPDPPAAPCAAPAAPPPALELRVL